MEAVAEKTCRRTFKIKTQDGDFTSRIMGSTPKQAALKALSIICNNYESGNKNFNVHEKKGKNSTPTFKFCIKETTRFSQHKEYTYIGKREKLENPASYTIKGTNGEEKVITNRYKNIVEKFRE